jgi:hypothetical protein
LARSPSHVDRCGLQFRKIEKVASVAHTVIAAYKINHGRGETASQCAATKRASLYMPREIESF